MGLEITTAGTSAEDWKENRSEVVLLELLIARFPQRVLHTLVDSADGPVPLARLTRDSRDVKEPLDPIPLQLSGRGRNHRCRVHGESAPHLAAQLVGYCVLHDTAGLVLLCTEVPGGCGRRLSVEAVHLHVCVFRNHPDVSYEDVLAVSGHEGDLLARILHERKGEYLHFGEAVRRLLNHQVGQRVVNEAIDVVRLIQSVFYRDLDLLLS